MMACACARTRWLVIGGLIATLLVVLLMRWQMVGRTDGRHLVRKGQAAHESGDFESAMAHFDRAVQVNPDDPAARRARGDAHYGVNDLTAALIDYDRLIELRPNDAQARYRRAKALLGLRREREMFDELHLALELDPAFGEARLRRAWVRFNTGDYEAAIRDLDLLIDEEGLRGGPTLVEILPLRAEARLSMGDDEGALADLEALRAAGGDPDEIERTTVWALWGMKRYDEALELIEGLVAGDPSSANLLLARGLTLMHLGRDDDSLRTLMDLRESGMAVAPEADFFLWVSQMRMGESESARAQLPPGDHFTRWHAMIADQLRGEVEESAVLAVAAAEEEEFPRARKQCEAFFYAGMKRLFEGDRPGAEELLGLCQATGIRRYYEYHAAVAELRRLSGATAGE